jgi:hypothetical protein
MILSLIVCNEADYTNNSRLMQLPGFALFPIVFAFSGDLAGPPYRNLKRQVGATFPTIPGIALCYWILHVIDRFDRTAIMGDFFLALLARHLASCTIFFSCYLHHPLDLLK